MLISGRLISRVIRRAAGFVLFAGRIAVVLDDHHPIGGVDSKPGHRHAAARAAVDAVPAGGANLRAAAKGAYWLSR